MSENMAARKWCHTLLAIFVSGALMVQEIILFLHYQNTQQRIQIYESLLPKYHELQSVIWTVSGFVFSLTLLITYSDSKSTQPVQQSALEASILNLLQFTLIGVLCAASRSLFALPYQLYFFICAVFGITTQRIFLQLALTALCLIEMVFQYGLFLTPITQSDLTENLGLAFTTGSKLRFWLLFPTLLLALERMKKTPVEVQSQQEPYFVSNFFCQFAIFFCLITPNVLNVPVMIVLAIQCFWSNELVCRAILGIFAITTLALYMLQLAENGLHSRQEQVQSDLRWVFGFQIYPTASKDLFPRQYECLLILAMGLCLNWPATLTPEPGTHSQEEAVNSKRKGCLTNFFDYCRYALISLRNIVMLHASKISKLLIGVLLVTFHVRLVNIIQFTLYLLICLFSDRKLFWHLLAAISFGIMATQYVIRIASRRYALEKNEELLVWGLAIQPQERQNPEAQQLLLYSQFFLIFGVTHIYHLVENSATMKILEQKYFKWDELMSPEAMNPQQKRDEDQLQDQSIDHERLSFISTQNQKQVDWLSWLFVKMNMYFLIGALGFISSLLPMSAPVLVLFLLMTVLVVKGLRHQTQSEFYSSINPFMLQFISFISLFALFTGFIARFMLQTDIWLSPSKPEEEEFNKSDWLIILLGLKQQSFAYRMLTFLLIIITSYNSIQLRYCPLLKTHSLERQRSIKEPTFFSKLLTYFVFSVQLALPTFLVVVVLIIELYTPQIVSFAALLVTFFIVYQQSSDFWKDAYKGIGIMIQVELFLSYLIQYCIFVKTEKDNLTIDKDNWLARMFEAFVNTQSQVKFVSGYWLFSIIFCCFLQQALSNMAKNFSIAQQAGVIEKCKNFKTQYLEIFIYSQGHNFLVLLLIIVITSKRNWTSFAYLFFLLRLLSIKLFPHQCVELHDDHYRDRQRVMVRFLTILILFVQVLMFIEYTLSYIVWIVDNDTQESKIKNLWSSFVREKLCFYDSATEEETMCVNDWNYFFELGKEGVLTRFYNWQILLLVVAYYYREYHSLRFTLSPAQQQKMPVLNDENDFTLRHDRSIFKNLVFSWLPYLFQLNLLFCVIQLQASEYSTVISCSYLCLAFYIQINFQSLYRENTDFLKPVRLFNFLLLTCYLVYQIPFFPCPYTPSEEEGSFVFISHDQCPKFGTRGQNTNFYMLSMQTLGLYKITLFPTAFCIIFLLTEIQFWAFHHPSFKIYVLERLKIDDSLRKMRAFMLVERTHLTRKWRYQTILLQKKILNMRYRRTMRNCNEILAEFDSEYTKEVCEDLDLDLIDEEIELQKLENETSLSNVVHRSEEKEELGALICDTCETQIQSVVEKPVVEILPLLVASLAQNGFGQMDIEEKQKVVEQQLVKLQKEKMYEDRLSLYSTEELGLSFAVPALQVLKNGSDYDFYYELFGSEKLLQRNTELILNSSSDIENDQLNRSGNLAEQMMYLTISYEYFRAFLWSLIDPIYYKSLASRDDFENQNLEKQSLFKILTLLTASYIELIVILLMFMVFIGNASLITLFFPLAALLYGILAPHLSKRFWQIVNVYLICEIFLKMLVQLPLFCSTPAFSIYQCINEEIEEKQLMSRIDFFIGLPKFNGPSSYPKNQGILVGLFWDLLLFLAIIYLRRFSWFSGQWAYINTSDRLQTQPKFVDDIQQSDHLSEQNTIRDKLKTFFYTLLPNYSPESEQSDFLAERFKPGYDYFTEMFFSNMAIFIYILLFWQFVIDNSSEINLNHFTKNQVLALLATLFLLLIERMLFRVRGDQGLAKHRMLIKLIIYLFQIAVIHWVLIFTIPSEGLWLSSMTGIKFLYLLLLMQLYFSGRQICLGYPTAPYKQTFLRDTSTMMVVMYQAYKIIPFVWEMKVIVDWTVTQTCLDLFQWFRYDDASKYLFYNKYIADGYAKRKEFEKRDWFEKCTMGFCFAFGIICIIMTPILLFSGLNPGQENNPILLADLKMQLAIEGKYYNIFTRQATQIYNYTSADEDNFLDKYLILNDDQNHMLQDIHFLRYSEENWQISDPSVEQLIKDYKNQPSVLQGQDEQNITTNPIKIKSIWEYTRQQPKGNEEAKQIIESQIEYEEFKPIIQLLSKKMEQSDPTDQTTQANEAKIVVPNLIPHLVKLDATQNAKHLSVAYQDSSETYNKTANITLILHQGRSNTYYWTMEPLADTESGQASLANSTNQTESVQVTVLSERVVGSVFSSATQIGVVGLYVGLIYALGTGLRAVFDKYSEQVMYEDLPNTEKLREIIEGIDTAQSEGKLKVEKQLFNLLIQIYRNPQLLLKITDLKQKYLPEESMEDDRQPLLQPNLADDSQNQEGEESKSLVMPNVTIIDQEENQSLLQTPENK